jgi:uridine phosphorylase
MKFIIFLGVLTLLCSSLSAIPSTEPIVTAEKYMEYKKKNGHFNEFISPKVVLVCYQQSTLQHLLEKNPEMKLSDAFSSLYLIEDGTVGILGGWGMGAPALSFKMEELIALGVRKFIAVGTAGTLMDTHQIGEFIVASKALAEDGVAHLYLKNRNFAKANQNLTCLWSNFAKNHALPDFHETGAWSFSAIFRETPADIIRVSKQGYHVVEMEAATLYAIGEEKGAQAISFFVISDSLSQENWIPHIKEPKVRNNLNKLSDWALEFCKEVAKSSSTSS